MIIVSSRKPYHVHVLLNSLQKLRKNDVSFQNLISTIKLSWTESFEVQDEHVIKSKINCISIYYLMYNHLYNMALNLDVAFLLSVSICCGYSKELNKTVLLSNQNTCLN